MLEATRPIAEGWYPDPLGRLWLRRWDGDSWTTEVRGASAQSQLGDSQANAAPGIEHAPRPETGWAGIAFAVRSALVSGEQVAVTVTIPGYNPLIINAHDHTYVWLEEPADLPHNTDGVELSFSRGAGAAQQQSRNLDGLLWRISHTAFRSRLAPWLQEGDLYRMQRWPNLTTINPELDDMRQAAMLANGMFAVDELAGFSDRALQPTLALINALSLMNTLKVAAPRETAFLAPAAGPVQPSVQPSAPQKPGLFQRLRARLGL